MKLDRLVRLISQEWAISPEVLENWCQILDAKLSGLEIPQDLAAAGSRRSSSDSDEPFTRDGNLAVIPVVGTLVKSNSFFSCDATYAQLRQAMTAALNAKGIDAIVLDGDTPGGTVAGCQETGDFIARCNRKKAVYGWVDDLAASAGYWLLSQTRMIGAHAAADIGSIGVMTVHYDRSGRDELNGVKRSVLAVGDMKAVGNDTAPLSDSDRAHIMNRLEQTYSLFIGAVTRGRPDLTADHIRGMQSRVYKAEQARNMGLIDQVMGRDEYMDHIKRQTRGQVSFPVRGVRAMTIEQLRAEHPELVSQIEATAREGLVPAAEVAKKAADILALHAVVFGEEAGQKFSAIVDSGVTADQAKALGVTASAEKPDLKQEMLAALHAAAPEGLKPGQVAVSPVSTTTIDTAAIYSARK